MMRQEHSTKPLYDAPSYVDLVIGLQDLTARVAELERLVRHLRASVAVTWAGVEEEP